MRINKTPIPRFVRLNKSIKFDYQMLAVVCVAIISGLYFFCVGERGYIETSDSVRYYTLEAYNSIRPIYPIFLLIHKMIFGKASFLSVVLISQTILAIFCSCIFTIYLKREFELSSPIALFVYLVSFLAYTLSFPHAVLNHYIWTEAIAYPLFYIFIMFLMRTLYMGGWKDIIGNIVITLILSLIRSQLQLLWVLSSASIVYSVGRVMIRKQNKKLYYFFIPIISTIVFISISIGGILLSVKSTELYHDIIRNIKLQTVVRGNIEIEDTKPKEFIRGENITSSQYNDIILSKVAYVAKRENVNLFETEQMQQTYLSWYVSLEQSGYLAYQRPDDMERWEHFAYATEKVANGNYEMINYTELPLYAVESEIIKEVLQANGSELLNYTVGLMIQGMTTAIVQEREQLKKIDSFIAFFLYTTAGLMTIYLLINKKSNKKIPFFMLIIMIVNCGIVGATTILFINEQRYLYYSIGSFAIAYLINLHEIHRINSHHEALENQVEKN